MCALLLAYLIVGLELQACSQVSFLDNIHLIKVTKVERFSSDTLEVGGKNNKTCESLIIHGVAMQY